MAMRVEATRLLARSTVVSSHDPTYLRALRHLVGWAKPVEWIPVGSNVGASDTSWPNGDRRALGLDEAAQYLAYFGQLDHTRGVEDLFEAVRLLRLEGRDVRALMVGSAGRPERYEQDTRSRAALASYLRLPHRLGIGDAVTWTPYLPDRDVIEHLAAADICVLPYRRNSIGRSALATVLAVGAPTILGGTTTGIAPLDPKRHVRAVTPGEPKQLAAEVAALLDDPSAARQLAEGAKRGARFFAWPRIAAAAINAYTIALQHRR